MARMAKITLYIPDDLLDQLTQVGDRLPDLLRLSLQKNVLFAHIYRYILDFITSKPNPEEIIAFRPTPEMSDPEGISLCERAYKLSSLVVTQKPSLLLKSKNSMNTNQLNI